MDEAKAAMDTDDKNVREERWNKLIDRWHELFLEDYPDMDKYLEEITYKFQKKIVKAWLLEGHRVDGRAQGRDPSPGRRSRRASPACTAPASSPAARPRCSPSPR